MGTNYYLHRKIPVRTKERLKSLITEETIYDGSLQAALNDFQPIHIGKSSIGWQFCFDHNDWKYYEASYQSINDFLEKEIADGSKLVNEYGTEISIKDLWDMVKEKREGYTGKSYYDYEMHRYQDYQKNPDKYKDDFFKPEKPLDYNLYPETFSGDKWHLRFGNSTDFC